MPGKKGMEHDINALTEIKVHTNMVFVYGTLMKDFPNHRRYLEGRIKRIIPAKTHGILYHLPEGYPALIPGNGTVRGEVAELIDDEYLKPLDLLEGYAEGSSDNLYKRELRTLMTDEGEEVTCWLYIFADEKYAREHGIPVPDGDWRKFMENRRGLI